MKKIVITVLFISLISLRINSQERYGKTLNMGLGIGYYGYYYGAAPAFNLNYEFDVFRNFTLAPFAAISSYKSYRAWGSNGYPYRDYYYRETMIPVGVKGSYYFDELFEAGDKWDFYLGASLGVVFRSTTWESGYYGERVVSNVTSPLFAALHIGTEYHMNQKVGLFLDLSTGYSTIGLGIHF